MLIKFKEILIRCCENKSKDDRGNIRRLCDTKSDFE